MKTITIYITSKNSIQLMQLFRSYEPVLFGTTKMGLAKERKEYSVETSPRNLLLLVSFTVKPPPPQ